MLKIFTIGCGYFWNVVTVKCIWKMKILYVTVVGDASQKTQQGPATTNKQPWQLKKYSCLEWYSLLSIILFTDYIFTILFTFIRVYFLLFNYYLFACKPFLILPFRSFLTYILQEFYYILISILLLGKHLPNFTDMTEEKIIICYLGCWSDVASESLRR